MTRMRPLVSEGKISRAVRDALDLRKKLLADGMDETEADRIVGQGLKSAWSNSVGQSGRVWHYYCPNCKDTGWIEIAADVNRMERMYGKDGAYHPLYRKCDPCNWLTHERQKREDQKAAANA